MLGRPSIYIGNLDNRQKGFRNFMKYVKVLMAAACKMVGGLDKLTLDSYMIIQSKGVTRARAIILGNQRLCLVP